MRFIARSKWREDQRALALAGCKPSESEPDWGLSSNKSQSVEHNPQDDMSFEELQAHYAERKKRAPKTIAEMRERGTLRGVSTADLDAIAKGKLPVEPES